MQTDLLTKKSTQSVLSESPISRNQPALELPLPNAATDRTGGRPIVRSPKDLHLHPALENLGWSGLLDELNDAAGTARRPIHDPILIATDGTVLTGFGRWRLAVFEQVPEIYCIEHSLSVDDSLQFILIHHQTRRGWNDFVRIRLALSMKPSLQQAALTNMRSGGKYKGLANLPEAHPVNVRQQIADIAGVCARNVGNVEAILETAHPSLIDALGRGSLKINRAMQLCSLSHSEQLAEFIRFSEERAISRVIRHCLMEPRNGDTNLTLGTVLGALHSRDEFPSGSTALRIVRNRRTVILVGQDLLAEINSQKELPLK